MKVIVLGATGTVGRLAVQAMLAEGYQVTAFARMPQRLGFDDPNLSLWAGDALDPLAVSDAVAGHEAAVVTLGAGADRRSVIRSQGTLNVIQAMQRHGVRRLIVQSTLGAHESWSNLDFMWKRLLFGFLLKQVHRDHELQEQLVRASGLDWTLVRPSAFVDDAPSAPIREGFGPDMHDLKLKIARSDVAAFLKRQLTDRRYAGQAVAIST